MALPKYESSHLTRYVKLPPMGVNIVLFAAGQVIDAWAAELVVDESELEIEPEAKTVVEVVEV